MINSQAGWGRAGRFAARVWVLWWRTFRDVEVVRRISWGWPQRPCESAMRWSSDAEEMGRCIVCWGWFLAAPLRLFADGEYIQDTPAPIEIVPQGYPTRSPDCVGALSTLSVFVPW